MNYLPLIALPLLTLFFIWRGYNRGFWRSLIRIISCLFGYVAAFFLTKPLSQILPIEGLIVYAAAGAIIFLSVSAIFDYLGSKLLTKNDEEDFESNFSKISGAILGGFLGCLTGLFLCYAINLKFKQNQIAQNHLLDLDVNSAVIKQEKISLPLLASVDSFVDRTSQKMVQRIVMGTVSIISDDPIKNAAAEILTTDPVELDRYFIGFLRDEEAMRILSEARIQQLMDQGNISGLLMDEEFQKLIKNRNVRMMTIGNHASKESDYLIAEIIIKAWRGYQKVSKDPRVIILLSDPNFMAELKGTNQFAITRNPKLKQLVDIIMEDLRI